MIRGLPRAGMAGASGNRTRLDRTARSVDAPPAPKYEARGQSDADLRHVMDPAA